MDATREPRKHDDGVRNSPHEQADLLLDQHWDALCRYAHPRVRDQAATEDVVQETLLAALRDQAQFRDDSTARTWLIGILRHKIADYWRQCHRRDFNETDQAVESLFDEAGSWHHAPGSWMPDPSQRSEDDDFWVVMEHCLDGLPLQARSVFAVRVIDGVSGEGDCKALGISATNLWVLLHRARLRLRTCLEKNWFSDERNGTA